MCVTISPTFQYFGKIPLPWALNSLRSAYIALARQILDVSMKLGKFLIQKLIPIKKPVPKIVKRTPKYPLKIRVPDKRKFDSIKIRVPDKPEFVPIYYFPVKKEKINPTIWTYIKRWRSRGIPCTEVVKYTPPITFIKKTIKKEIMPDFFYKIPSYNWTPDEKAIVQRIYNSYLSEYNSYISDKPIFKPDGVISIPWRPKTKKFFRGFIKDNQIDFITNKILAFAIKSNPGASTVEKVTETVKTNTGNFTSMHLLVLGVLATNLYIYDSD